jgi:hypothetical protein
MDRSSIPFDRKSRKASRCLKPGGDQHTYSILRSARMIGAISLLLFVACALLAFIDLRRGIIPNWLNLAIAGVARAALIKGATSAFAARSSACGASVRCR